MSSEVWKYFVIDRQNSGYAICQICKCTISRGGKSKTTTNMKKHLENKHGSYVHETKKQRLHSSELSEIEENEIDDSSAQNCSSETTLPLSSNSDVRPTATDSSRGSGSVSPRHAEKVGQTNISSRTPNQYRLTPKSQYQPTLQSFIDKTAQFKSTDPRAKSITQHKGRMMCLDNRPFSMVEDRGFTEFVKFLEPRYVLPSRKHFSNTVVPHMYQECRENVNKKLDEAEHVSLTTDMWTSTANDDYLGLTVHFVDSNFVLQHLNIGVIPFPELSHTGNNLCNFITETLEEWKLQSKVVAIVRDNARNITAGLESSEYEHLPCLAHTLQLVVKEGLLNNKNVNNLIANGRRIVGHFKHSCKATKELKKAQATLKMKKHKLIQDEPTRWNSSLHMLQRLLEQKQSVSLASATLQLPVTFSSAEWNLMTNVVNLLSIFNHATLAVSTQCVTASEVIPIINSSTEELRKPAPTGSGVQGIKNDMLAAITLKYSDVEENMLYAVATLLDPRFKHHVFVQDGNVTKAKVFLIEEARKTICLKQPETESVPQTSSQAMESHGMWTFYSNIMKTAPSVSHIASVEDEINVYLEEPIQNSSTNVFQYWKENTKYPCLKKLSKKFLCIPPSTVHSERLFSTAGLIVDQKRNRLDPERVKMLVFLNKNL
ncbi:zinc finger BED domain-containing protein 4-like [Bacillus rossius redtenbacheri]|uniref:zinc finger BED domain-containing protein 4-like n=1 Tax=Bacillus rossius redtenbacheri TaxID=93214 RepID=UPI002FDEA51D